MNRYHQNNEKALNTIKQMIESNEFTRVQENILEDISKLLKLISSDEEIKTHDITDFINSIL